MCGRFASTSSPAALAQTFDVDEISIETGLPERYNVAPTSDVYAVTERAPGCRALRTLRWGLVPSWAKDPSIGARMINARSDTVATKPAYRSALARRRAIIPIDAFYEWQARPGTAAGKAPKQPWAIRRVDGQPMAAAGLWEVWRSPTDPDEILHTCAIVTTEPNEVTSPIHDRMPVLLDRWSWDRWLDPKSDPDGLLELLVPFPATELEAWPVSTAVNHAANEGAHLLDPAEVPTPKASHATPGKLLT